MTTPDLHQKQNILIKLPQLNIDISSPKGGNLFSILRSHKIPIAQSCEGEGICGTCSVYVEPGSSCTPVSARERRVKFANQLHEKIRLSCLIRIYEDVIVTTMYW